MSRFCPIPGNTISRLCLLVLGVFATLSGCSEPIAVPSRALSSQRISQNILDANHAGNKHFFFLPPMVNGLSQGFGTSDGTLRPTVVVCEWKSDNGGSCGAIVAQFARTGGATARDIVYDATSEQYQVNWKTDQCDAGACTLDPAKTYRLRVLVGAYDLGHADIDVVSNGSQLKNVETGEYIGLVDGRTLPIKFRIEQGAVWKATSTNPVSVGVEGGVVTNESGTVALEFQNGSLSDTKPISIQPVTTPLFGANDFSPPVELGPDGTTFDKPVTLTLAFDGRKVPPGVPFDKLAIWVWKGDSWDIVPNSVVNVTDNTVSAPISHFSIYQVGLWWWRPDPSLNAYVLTVGGAVNLAASVTAYDVVPATYCNTVYGQDASGAWGYSQVCNTVPQTYSYIPYGLRVSFLALDPQWQPLPPNWKIFREYILPDGGSITGYLPQDPFHPVYPSPSNVARFDPPGYGIVGATQIGSAGAAVSPTLRGLAEGVVSFGVLTGSELSWRWGLRVLCPARSLSVDPSTAQLSTVSPGNTVQLTATRRDASNTVVNGCNNASWLSSNNAVATVDGTGLVTAHAPGTATITAHASGINPGFSLTATAAITVKVPGYRIVYDAGDPATLLTQVIIQNIDGSDRHVLTSYNLHGGGIGSMAHWFPSGDMLVFQIANPQNGDLYFINENAVNADPNLEAKVTNNSGLNVGAVVSPRNDRIVFLSTRTGDYELWSMDLAGRNQVQVTHNPGGDSPGGFALDGHRFAFTRNNATSYDYDVWVLDFDQPNGDGTYAEYRVTSVGGGMSNVRWSPTEDRLILARNGALYLVDPNGHGQSIDQLTPIDLHGFAYPAIDPQWSPDGKKIMFTAANQWELYIVDATGGVPEKIPTPTNLQKGFASFDPVP